MRAILVMLLVAGNALAMPTRRDLDRVLAGFEQVVNADHVKSLGAGTDTALIGYIEDPTVNSLRRQRALGALRHVPSSTVRDYLLARIKAHKAADHGAEVLELAAAIGALAPYGTAVLSSLLPFLSHPAPDVRQSTAAALEAIHSDTTANALAARIAVETDPGVQTALRSALQACRR